MGLACILILLGAVLRRPAWRKAALLAAFLLLYLGGNRWVSYALARSLEWRYLPTGEIPQADVIVVLAGGTASAEAPRPTVEVQQAGDRVIYAASLYHQGKAPNLLLAGGRIEWLSTGPEPTSDMAALLEMLAVPASALWYEPGSRNTFESAVNCKKFLDAVGIQRIILVTSASHMPRSVGLFEHQGFEVIPAPTDFIVTRSGWENLVGGSLKGWPLQLIPTSGNLEITSLMLKEYFGILVYKLRGEL